MKSTIINYSGMLIKKTIFSILCYGMALLLVCGSSRLYGMETRGKPMEAQGPSVDLMKELEADQREFDTFITAYDNKYSTSAQKEALLSMLKKLVFKERPFIPALYILGELHYTGWYHTDQNVQVALNYISQAASHGYPPAHYFLAMHHLERSLLARPFYANGKIVPHVWRPAVQLYEYARGLLPNEHVFEPVVLMDDSSKTDEFGQVSSLSNDVAIKCLCIKDLLAASKFDKAGQYVDEFIKSCKSIKDVQILFSSKTYNDYLVKASLSNDIIAMHCASLWLKIKDLPGTPSNEIKELIGISRDRDFNAECFIKALDFYAKALEHGDLSAAVNIINCLKQFDPDAALMKKIVPKLCSLSISKEHQESFGAIMWKQILASKDESYVKFLLVNGRQVLLQSQSCLESFPEIIEKMSERSHEVQQAFVTVFLSRFGNAYVALKDLLVKSPLVKEVSFALDPKKSDVALLQETLEKAYKEKDLIAVLKTVKKIIKSTNKKFKRQKKDELLEKLHAFLSTLSPTDLELTAWYRAGFEALEFGDEYVKLCLDKAEERVVLDEVKLPTQRKLFYESKIYPLIRKKVHNKDSFWDSWLRVLFASRLERPITSREVLCKDYEQLFRFIDLSECQYDEQTIADVRLSYAQIAQDIVPQVVVDSSLLKGLGIKICCENQPNGSGTESLKEFVGLLFKKENGFFQENYAVIQQVFESFLKRFADNPQHMFDFGMSLLNLFSYTTYGYFLQTACKAFDAYLEYVAQHQQCVHNIGHIDELEKTFQVLRQKKCKDPARLLHIILKLNINLSLQAIWNPKYFEKSLNLILKFQGLTSAEMCAINGELGASIEDYGLKMINPSQEDHDFDKAIKFYEQILRIKPDSKIAKCEIAIFSFCRAQENNASESELQRLLQTVHNLYKEGDVFAGYRYGQQLQRIGKDDEALKVFREILPLDFEHKLKGEIEQYCCRQLLFAEDLTIDEVDLLITKLEEGLTKDLSLEKFLAFAYVRKAMILNNEAEKKQLSTKAVDLIHELDSVMVSVLKAKISIGLGLAVEEAEIKKAIDSLFEYMRPGLFIQVFNALALENDLERLAKDLRYEAMQFLAKYYYLKGTQSKVSDSATKETLRKAYQYYVRIILNQTKNHASSHRNKQIALAKAYLADIDTCRLIITGLAAEDQKNKCITALKNLYFIVENHVVLTNEDERLFWDVFGRVNDRVRSIIQNMQGTNKLKAEYDRVIPHIRDYLNNYVLD